MWFDVVTLVWCRLEKVLGVGRWVDFVDFEVSVINVHHVDVVVHALTVDIVCQVRISRKLSTKHMGNLPATRARFFFFRTTLFFLFTASFPVCVASASETSETMTDDGRFVDGGVLNGEGVLGIAVLTLVVVWPSPTASSSKWVDVDCVGMGVMVHGRGRSGDGGAELARLRRCLVGGG